MKVSLCVIAKDEERNLEACVTPLVPIVDEIVVVDTGSTDATADIARRVGARVFAFPWRNSFSAARNEAIDRARGDWILWLDADDRVNPDARDRIERILKDLPSHPVGYLMSCMSLASNGDLLSETGHLRLFPRRADVRWEYRVHEQITPALDRVGARLEKTDVVIVHHGYADPALLAEKQARNLPLIELDCLERPGDPFPLFCRGGVLNELGRFEEAIVSLQLAAGIAQGQGRRDVKLEAMCCVFLVRAHLGAKDYAGATTTLSHGLELHPNEPELQYHDAVLLTSRRMYPAAAVRLEGLLALVDAARVLPPTPLLSRVRHLLATVYLFESRFADAEREARAVLARDPMRAAARAVLVEALRAQGRPFDEVADAAKAACAVLRVTRLLNTGDVTQALEVAAAAATQHPENRAVARALSRAKSQAGRTVP